MSGSLTGEWWQGENKMGNECVFGGTSLWTCDTQRSPEAQVCQYPHRWQDESNSLCLSFPYLSKGKDNPYLSFHNILRRVWDHIITAVKKYPQNIQNPPKYFGTGHGCFPSQIVILSVLCHCSWDASGDLLISWSSIPTFTSSSVTLYSIAHSQQATASKPLNLSGSQ